MRTIAATASGPNLNGYPPHFAFLKVRQGMIRALQEAGELPEEDARGFWPS